MTRNRKALPNAVTWLSEKIPGPQCLSNSFYHYEKFQFQNIVAEIGDYVLISNADAAEPDTEAGCDAARIVSLYEDTSNKNDPFRAKVQWYSRPSDLPNWCFNNMEPITFFEKDVIEDHRAFNTDVSIETFFKKCSITLTFTKDIERNIESAFHYICRYRLMALSKRKVKIEPVVEDERRAIELLCTPAKSHSSPGTAKTPNSLVKRMSRVSISEQKNWSVTKNDGTKLLLKRAILADKSEKGSPKNATPRTPKTSLSETTRSTKKLNRINIEEVLTMELKENSDDELPTLIIRQHVPTTPKRKQSVTKTNEETPKKVLLFEDEDKTPYATRSGRVTKNPKNYKEPDVSPVKRTPRKLRNVSENDDDFILTPKTPKTPRTPRSSRTTGTPRQTPKRSVTRRILTSQLTPTLHSRAHSVDNIEGNSYFHTFLHNSNDT